MAELASLAAPAGGSGEGDFLEILAARVASNSQFRRAARQAEKAHLQKELGFDAPVLAPDIIKKLIEASAILAASRDVALRQLAYRTATNVHILARNSDLSCASALRVVLARLGNFAAFATDEDVAKAAADLPLPMLVEEIEAASERTVLVGSKESVLTDFQHTLWGIFTGRGDAAITAPTSTGKSFVLQIYLNSRFLGIRNLAVVYVVPTRALILQVSDDLEEAVEELGADRPRIITVPPEQNDRLGSRAIYVFTPERLQLLLQAHPEFRPDLIVVDEAHLLGEGSRGILMQWVLDDVLAAHPRPQILFASPTIANLGVFGETFDLPEIIEARSAEPTVAQNFLVVKVLDRKTGNVEVTSLGDGKSPEMRLGSVQLQRPLWSRFDKLANIPAELGKDCLNIIYVNGQDDAERVALRLAEIHLDREPTPAQQSLAQLARETVHPMYALAKCLSHGVGYHYSSMPASLRTALEHAFGRGEVKFMVCTSTLLQGVNSPAQNIFMFAPEKGSGRPIAPVDFWNLSGRAGRLRKEFQGNIFLIDYGSWRSRPLSGSRDAAIVPAIRTAISRIEPLTELIRNVPDRRLRNPLDLESAFGKLLVEHQRGTLSEALRRSGIPANSQAGRNVTSALIAAAHDISIPADILKQSSNVSPHKQQKLYDELVRRIRRRPRIAQLLLSPRHPWERGAYNSYRRILRLCHRIVWEMPESSRLHRFHALIARSWMRGYPLPRIVGEQLRRSPRKEPRKVIRDTLSLVEDEIRFRAVRVFTTYNSLLALAYRNEGISFDPDSIESIPLFLELGASDRTMISLMELGLSRASAVRMARLAGRQNRSMTAREALTWLSGLALEEVRLSLAMKAEIDRVRARPLPAE